MTLPRTVIDADGTIWPSISAFARARGVTPQAAGWAVRRGDASRVGGGASGPRPMRVSIAGRLFGTAAEAARFYGVAPVTVLGWVARGAPPQWVTGRRRRRVHRPAIVTFRGVCWANAADCERQLRLRRGTVGRWRRGCDLARVDMAAGLMRLLAGIDQAERSRRDVLAAAQTRERLEAV